MVSANLSKTAHVLSESLTDVLIGLLRYLNMSAKRKLLHNKHAQKLPGCNSRREGTCMLTSYLSFSDLPSSLWQMPLCPRCLTITSAHKEEPHVLGNPTENWTPDKEQWPCKAFATKSQETSKHNCRKRAMYVFSFTVSLLASKIPQTDYRILI